MIKNTTTKALILQELTKLAKEQLHWDEETLSKANSGADLADYLDSMKRLSLVIAIEDHWQICLEPEHEESVRTLNDLLEVISKLLEQPPQGDQTQ